MTDITANTTPAVPSSNIAPPATKVKRRGKKPSGIVKDNVCVRLTAESKDYLLGVGKGSTSRGVDALIDWHRRQAQQSVATP